MDEKSVPDWVAESVGDLPAAQEEKKKEYDPGALDASAARKKREGAPPGLTVKGGDRVLPGEREQRQRVGDILPDEVIDPLAGIGSSSRRPGRHQRKAGETPRLEGRSDSN